MFDFCLKFSWISFVLWVKLHKHFGWDAWLWLYSPGLRGSLIDIEIVPHIHKLLMPSIPHCWSVPKTGSQLCVLKDSWMYRFLGGNCNCSWELTTKKKIQNILMCAADLHLWWIMMKDIKVCNTIILFHVRHEWKLWWLAVQWARW